MSPRLAPDPCPGAPRVLFVGLGHSSHTHGWIDLLRDSGLNVRLFSMNEGAPPDSWPTPTYVSSFPPVRGSVPGTRENLHLPGRAGRWATRALAAFGPGGAQNMGGRWLSRILRQWRPHVVHTLGLRYAAYFYRHVQKTFGPDPGPLWVAQARGGPDLALDRLDPEFSGRIAEVLAHCDAFIADNARNYELALELGLAPGKVSPLGPVPGAGGVDLAELATLRAGPPSTRTRTIVWPKAYEGRQSTARPVLEALSRVFERIRPEAVHMLAASPETLDWWREQSAHVRERCHLHGRIPNAETLRLLGQARVMLAPSLSDGVPNSLYEAMALGALPVLSPLQTITPLVRGGENVLFCRNLYPDEIAEALVRAMEDDGLADAAAGRNLELVARLADRADIARRVRRMYLDLAAGRR